MKLNVGSFDRVIRLLLGLGLIALYYFEIQTGTVGLVMLVVGAVLVLTAAVSFCPLYTLLGFSTKK